jgi:hypothetical protein
MKALYTLAFCTAFFLSACEEGPWVKHEMKAEKKGTCTNEISSVKMESNINGERYVFDECLPENFDGKTYEVVRKGDSLLVRFPAAPSAATALFTLTLDIQANPVYTTIKLGERDPITIKTITKF